MHIGLPLRKTTKKKITFEKKILCNKSCNLALSKFISMLKVSTRPTCMYHSVFTVGVLVITQLLSQIPGRDGFPSY